MKRGRKLIFTAYFFYTFFKLSKISIIRLFSMITKYIGAVSPSIPSQRSDPGCADGAKWHGDHQWQGCRKTRCPDRWSAVPIDHASRLRPCSISSGHFIRIWGGRVVRIFSTQIKKDILVGVAPGFSFNDGGLDQDFNARIFFDGCDRLS